MKLLRILLLHVVIAGLFLPVNGFALLYTADLDGVSSFPPNASPGTGFAEVDLDTIIHALKVQVSFSGLSGNTTVSHIHGPTPGPGTGAAGVATQVPTFPGFPSGVTSGNYSQTFDTTLTTTFNPSFLNANGGTAAGAEAALAASLAAGTSYFNIHTTLFPAGEIRGFLTPVPEPATVLLLCSGLAGLAFYSQKKRKS